MDKFLTLIKEALGGRMVVTKDSSNLDEFGEEYYIFSDVELMEGNDLMSIGDVYFTLIAKESSVELMEIEVNPKHRKKGLATKVVKVLKEVSQRCGYKEFGVVSIYNPVMFTICDKIGLIEHQSDDARFITFN